MQYNMKTLFDLYLQDFLYCKKLFINLYALLSLHFIFHCTKTISIAISINAAVHQSL